MAPDTARFILRAHRDDGRYRREDPLFADALGAADSSPELTAWLESEHALDAIVAHKLDGIVPPAGLRDTILAGARASRRQRRWWQAPGWLALAASLAVAGPLILVQVSQPPPPSRDAAMLEWVFTDAADPRHDHGFSSPEAHALFASLRASAGPLTGGRAPDFATLRDAGCKRFSVGGREIVEICVVRNGRWFHLYATPRHGADNAPSPPVVTERGPVAVATWSTASTTYALASVYGRDALTDLI
jgi:hypothetical protein